MPQTADRIHRSLRRRILAGELGAGARLREEQLAAEFEISRTPVREAIRRLHAESLVTLSPNRGAEVRHWDAGDYEELFELRELLEGHAARRAAERGEADLDALTSLCERMERLRDDLLAGRGEAEQTYGEITRLNLELHRSVHVAGGRRLLPEMLLGLIEVPLVRRTFDRYGDAQLQRSFAQHRDVVAAIAAGDGAWAHAAMTTHLRGARATHRLDIDGPEDPAIAPPIPHLEEQQP